ncbi:MAG: SsrA-binding protein SmpB [Chloroflexi bacterium]|nr:SsrA-binding protein SmpB [Chloroflexota bacterium]
MSETTRVLASNRHVYHDFFIDETFEAGLALTGSEIKSVRAGQINLKECYATIRHGEVWLIGSHIAPYEPSSRDNHDPLRDRRLLLHKGEIVRLAAKIKQKGFTLVATRVYLKKNRAKIEIGLARGKKQYDKRDTIAARDAKREIDRAVKQR